MNQHESSELEVRRVPRAIKLGVLAMLGGIIWFVIGTVAIGFVGWGDGSVRSATAAQKMTHYMPSAYCFVIAFSCLPFVYGRIFLITLGLLANGILATILWRIFTHLSQWRDTNTALNLSLIILPLLYLDVQWIALCKQRIKDDP